MKIITVSGSSGSGKSTLTKYLSEKIKGSVIVSLDRYYLSKKEQINRNGYFNFDEPAALDTDLLQSDIKELKKSGAASLPTYDFTVSARSGYETLTAKNAIIVDGLFAGSVIGHLSDISIFVDVDLKKALKRRIERDIAERGRSMESVLEQFENQVRPAYFKFIKPLRNSSDYVLKNNTTIENLLQDARKILSITD